MSSSPTGAKSTIGSFLSSFMRHVLSGVPRDNSRKRNIGVTGTQPEGWQADSNRSLARFTSSGTHGNYLHAVTMKKACFFWNFLLPKASNNRHMVLFGHLD